jgi:L-ascorbate metabolism protein UlaG (beta-lactamase superfamily)
MKSIQFGGRITQAHKEIYQQSVNWENGKFKNLEETPSAIDWKKIPGMICKQIKGHKYGYPKGKLPIEPFDADKFYSAKSNAQFIWYGHSVVLMNLNGKTILIDPMLGEDASPVGPKRTKRFSENTLDICKSLPDIDLILLTHDHYDHLDFASIQILKSKTRNYYVSLGLKRHLMAWGVEENLIKEFDWWDKADFEGIQITFTPSRHFSGRGLTSIARCLWGGWSFKTATDSIWFSGDGGYGEHFKTIGQELGPIDFAFMECGQYSPDWALIHMFPEESVRAAMDAGAKKVMPVHWGGFNLSYHHAWFEPVEDFIHHSKQNQIEFIVPEIGRVFEYEQELDNFWWKPFI